MKLTKRGETVVFILVCLIVTALLAIAGYIGTNP